MAYWWVNQNQTHRDEHSEGYLWAPLKNKAGRTDKYWELMDRVEPGDFIFSYVDQKISKIATAQTRSFPANKPVGKSFDPWQKEGRRIEAKYFDLPNPLTNLYLQETIGSDLMGTGIDRPLRDDGKGKQSYFFSLQPKVGRRIYELSGLKHDVLGQDLSLVISQDPSTGPSTETTRKELRKSRIGQGKFRRDVLRAWNDCCSVTGTNIQEAIRASHIKPWADSNNRERLDAHNGLALVATLDSLFDKGLITFDSDGQIIIHVTRNQWDFLGLREDLRLRHKPTTAMCEYLEHHREHVVTK